MIRLLRVELTRLRWRRAAVLLLLTAVVVPVVIAAATAWHTRSATDAERAEVQELVERDTASARGEVEDCVASPDNWGLPADDPGLRAQCEEMILPQAEWYGLREDLDLTGELGGSLTAVVVVTALLMMLLGTTFAGHDWSTGSMSNQLLFQPRRGRVWLAKALAVTGTGLVVAAGVAAAYWTGLYALAGWRDLTPPPGVVGDGYELVLRGAGIAAAAALGGYALTMLFRSTVATLGILFAVALLGGMLIAVLGIGDGARWQPDANLTAVIQNGVEVWVEVPEDCYAESMPAPDPDGPSEGGRCDDSRTLTATQGSAYYGVLLLGAGGLSVASFRRRDVP